MPTPIEPLKSFVIGGPSSGRCGDLVVCQSQDAPTNCCQALARIEGETREINSRQHPWTFWLVPRIHFLP